MPNYQHHLNEPASFITLQNVQWTEDTGSFDSVREINDLTPDNIVYCEMPTECNGPYLNIIEQPADTFRYRYKSEKGSHGGIKGENATRSKKSFPTIKVENCPPNLRKKVVVKVSLYFNQPELKHHVYELTGKNADGAKLDDNFLAKFQSLAISTRKKEEVSEILKERKRADYDSLGFSYDEASLEAEAQEEIKSLNLDSAKLCFEAFSDDTNTPLCEKVFSRPINNQKSAATGDLKIARISRCSGKCSGGDEVFLLCEKVKKEDIKVRFFDEENAWEDFAEFNNTDIHHQVAIVFKTPKYKENVGRNVLFELYRPSDKKCSDPRPFEYIRDDDGILNSSNKRRRKTQIPNVVKDVPSEIPSKRSKLNCELYTELPESFLQNSSLMDSPVSNVDEHSSSDNDDPGKNISSIFTPDFTSDFKTEDVEMLPHINLEDLEGTLFADLFDIQPVSSSVGEIQFESDLFTPDVPNQQPELFPQSYPEYVKVDGFDDISNMIRSMSLADQCCKEELKKLRIEKASNDFVFGMKRIFESRNERTMHHYATHLIPLQDEDGNSMLHLGIMEQNDNWNFILIMVKMAAEDLINHQNELKETPLHLAVKGNHAKILLLLLARGGNPNILDRNGNNCLHLAAKYGHIDCLKVLLPSSGNITWKHKITDIDVLNYDGLSALHLAVMGNFEDCLNFLLNHKADVNLSEKKCGRTCLHMAIGHPSILQIVLKQPNLDIDAEDFGGYTPLHLACLRTGKPFEVVSAQLKDDKDGILKFLGNLNQDVECDSSPSDGESTTDSSEFEDAVEDFSSTSSTVVVCKTASTSKFISTNEEKSSLMKIEEELHKYLDRDGNWKLLADLVGLDTKHVALLDKGLSPGQTVLRKIKDLYHPCQIQTIIEILQLAGLEEGVRILQNNSQC